MLISTQNVYHTFEEKYFYLILKMPNKKKLWRW